MKTRQTMDYKDKVIELLNSDELTREQKTKLREVFPEIKESEDERIRNNCIHFLDLQKSHHASTIEIDECIAWLEKKGEQNLVKANEEWYDFIRWFVKERTDNYTLIPSDDDIHKWGDMILNHAQKIFEKQGEQKPVDFSDLRTWKYIVDAVLTEKEGIGQHLDSAFTEEVAKKLQKRFGNIEQKPAWSEEDKEMSRFIGNAITTDDSSVYLKSKGIEVIDAHVWLDELKDRVQPQPNQEWSEEDEEVIKSLISYLENEYGTSYTDEDKRLFTRQIEILKSFRPQNTWKPSDEQMKALDIAIRCGIQLGTWEETSLKDLREQLKKL